MDLVNDPDVKISDTGLDTIPGITGTSGMDSVVTVLDSTQHSDLRLSLSLRCPTAWLDKLRQEPPVGQSLMLIQLLESFADGADGVKVHIEIR